ncbi:MAG: hypothetical protein ACTHNW_15625, partial [Mucilaginibacter sp.]
MKPSIFGWLFCLYLCGQTTMSWGGTDPKHLPPKKRNKNSLNKTWLCFLFCVLNLRLSQITNN